METVDIHAFGREYERNGSGYSHFASALAGGVLGFLGARYLGGSTEISTIGGLFGMLVSPVAYTALNEIADDIKYLRFKRSEERKNKIAKKNRSPCATFRYQKKRLECVIRSDHIDGADFNMEIEDGIIWDPVFSYRPNGEEQLSFGFNFLYLHPKNNRETKAESDEIDTGTEFQGDKLESFQYNGYLDCISKDFERLIRRFHNISNEKENLRIKLDFGLLCRFELGYSGDRFNSDLILAYFANFGSQMMNETYKFLTENDARFSSATESR